MTRSERRTWDNIINLIKTRLDSFENKLDPSFKSLSAGPNKISLYEKLKYLHEVSILLQNNFSQSSIIPDSHHATIELEQLENQVVCRRAIIIYSDDKLFSIRYNPTLGDLANTHTKKVQTPDDVVRLIKVIFHIQTDS